MDNRILLSKDTVTKYRFLKAVDCPLCDLTVETICKNAGLTKRTFYNHFESKYEIPYWYSQLGRLSYYNEIGRTLDWQQGLSLHFSFLYPEREFYRFCTFGGSESSYIKRNEQHRRSNFIKTLTEFKQIELNEELLFDLTLYLRIESIFVEEWFQNGMVMLPDTFSRYLVGCVPLKLYKAIELPMTGHGRTGTVTYGSHGHIR